MIFALSDFIIAQAGAGNSAPGWMNAIPLVLMVVVFYFILIRPQQKRAKEHENTLKTLKAGDKVLVSGGIVGVVISVKDKNVSIRSADSKFEVLKSAVTEITERGGESTESK
jgi:preprotein translocase subunit YajC